MIFLQVRIKKYFYNLGNSTVYNVLYFTVFLDANICMLSVFHHIRRVSMLQMFDNVASLRFVSGPNGETLANAMISAEGEVMEFKSPTAAEGRVEDWMTDVLAEMRSTNRLITKEALFFYCEKKSRWVVGVDRKRPHQCFSVFVKLFKLSPVS